MSDRFMQLNKKLTTWDNFSRVDVCVHFVGFAFVGLVAFYL